MNLNDLYTFSIVAKLGTLTEAAKYLERPKSTVSRRLIRLEENLGVELFSRSPRRVVLTQDGRAFYERISRSLEELIQAQKMLQEKNNEPSGILRITTTEGYGQTPALLSCLSSYMEKYPKVCIDLILTSRITNLVEDQIDLGLRLHTGALPGDASTMARRLHQVSSGLFASPAYVKKNGCPKNIEELNKHDFIAFGGISFSEKPWLFQGEPFRKPMPFATPKMTVNNTGALLHCALIGMGICILEQVSIQSFVKKGDLIPILPEFEQQIARVSLVWVSSKHLSVKIRSFIDHAVEHLGS